MVGKSLQHEHRPERAPSQKIVLKAEEVCVRGAEGLLAVDHVSFSLRAGEVLGVAGIEGNGQTQLAQALLGLLPLKSGQFLFDGLQPCRTIDQSDSKGRRGKHTG